MFIASRLEAIAIRVEAIASMLEANGPHLFGKAWTRGLAVPARWVVFPSSPLFPSFAHCQMGTAQATGRRQRALRHLQQPLHSRLGSCED